MADKNASKSVLLYSKNESAFELSRTNEKAAGITLKSPIYSTLKAASKLVIPLNLKINLPTGTYGRIAPKGISEMDFVTIGGGVIDEDYRGVVSVILFNHEGHDIEIKRGDVVAQLICQQLANVELAEVAVISDETQRGDQGLGSTGI